MTLLCIFSAKEKAEVAAKQEAMDQANSNVNKSIAAADVIFQGETSTSGRKRKKTNRVS